MEGRGDYGHTRTKASVVEEPKEKSTRQRYSEQHEKLVSRLAIRKEKARLGDCNQSLETKSDSTKSVVSEVPNIAGAKFASELEAQWQNKDGSERLVEDANTSSKDIAFSQSKEDKSMTPRTTKSKIERSDKNAENKNFENEKNAEKNSRSLSSKESEVKHGLSTKDSSVTKDKSQDVRQTDNRSNKKKEEVTGKGRRKESDRDTRYSKKEDARTGRLKNIHEKDSRPGKRVVSKITQVQDTEGSSAEKGGDSKDTVTDTYSSNNDTSNTPHNTVPSEEPNILTEEKVEIDEEEQARLAEEKRRQEEEENEARLKEQAEKQEQEEKATLETFLKEQDEKVSLKNSLRDQNISAADKRPDESFFFKLDSSLKKNTAFVKKVKSLTENQGDALLKEFKGLNLSKYVGEVASAITDAKLKMSDIPLTLKLCSLLFQRYADFSPMLLDNFQKQLLTKKDTKIANPSKLRVEIRLIAELTAICIFPGNKGLGFLASQLAYLVNIGKEDSSVLPIITTFCKHCGDDYAGLIPRNIRLLAEKHGAVLTRNKFLPPERQIACRNLLKEFYNSVCDELIGKHKTLKKIEYGNFQSLKTKGELSQDRKDLYEQAFDAYHKLYGNVTTLSNMLDEDMPNLPDEEIKQDPESVLLDICNPTSQDFNGDAELFEDEDTKMFYEKFPDLKAIIPSILYKESEQVTSSEETKDEESGLDEDLAIEDIDGEKVLTDNDALNKDLLDSDDSAIGESPPMLLSDITEEDTTDTNIVMKSQLELFLASLPTCVNRDLIDKAAIEFCMNFNTKINRKKLVRALFNVHRTRYDLLPFYSRLVATLYPCMPDIANELTTGLKSEMKWHIRKRIQHNIESKLKTARFIGELVKFKIFSKSECLGLMKMLILTFTNHNIEMVCAMLETCGKFLYRSKDSHYRTNIYLDVLLRKKTTMHLDGRHLAMIENAYYYCNPPDLASIPKKVRPPMHEYIRKLLFRDLAKTTIEKVLRQIRKLDWENNDARDYITKCLRQPWNIRYNVIHCLASLVSGLLPYHEDVCLTVADAIIEDIRIGIEINHPRYNQRRVSCIKYLGEMYIYRIIESSVVFKVLYSLITYGVTFDEKQISWLDPPEHLLRLRLVCVLLDTCGQYFDSGSSKRRLSCFLVYFQRYYWFKRKNPVWTESRPFPIEINNLYDDTLAALQATDVYCSWDEAEKAASALDAEFRLKIAKLLPEFKALVDENDPPISSDMDGLTTVLEEDETDDLPESMAEFGPDEGGSTLGSDNSQGQLSQGNLPCRDSGSDADLEGSPMEDRVKVKRGLKHIQCDEDDEFVQAFDKMLNDTMQARSQETLKVPHLDLAVPMRVKTKKPNEETNEKPINFVLITRKGNKQQFSTMEVPISEEFASKYREREKAEIEEKQKIKEAVLNIHVRQEEEDYQELIASLTRSVVINTNRERRVQYQHPKGAPDADLIFGSKKR